MAEALTTLAGPAAPLMAANINTDMIAPLYMPGAAAGQSFGMSREDLSRLLFASWRYDMQERERPDFVLNREPFRSAKFVVAGPNFGCGSSRDTAPRMLEAFGVRCVIAQSFGGIFFDNCFKAGVLPMVLPSSDVQSLAAEAETGNDFRMDLAAQTLSAPSGAVCRFDIPEFRREQLLTGADDITLTLRRNNDILAYQANEKAMRPWTFLPPRRIR